MSEELSLGGGYAQPITGRVFKLFQSNDCLHGTRILTEFWMWKQGSEIWQGKVELRLFFSDVYSETLVKII